MDKELLEDFFKEEDTHWWHAAKRELIKSFIPQGPGRALVLGIGGGRLCWELSPAFDVVGADISLESCKHLREHFGIEAVDCDFEQGLPFTDGTFDAVVIADVLEHIQDDRKLVAEMHRCLKSGGTLLLTVPAYASLWSHWDQRLQHRRRYEYQGLKEVITSGRFQVEKISFFHTLLYPAAFVRRKFFGNRGKSISDFKLSQGGIWTNRIMNGYYRLERRWMKSGRLPFGLSLFVYARKYE